jgi:hypothetical protein
LGWHEQYHWLALAHNLLKNQKKIITTLYDDDHHDDDDDGLVGKDHRCKR